MPENRSKSGQFQKGESGNPGGRPKLTQEILDVRAAAREHTPAAIATLVNVLDSKDPRARVAAASALLDRGWGKPNQDLAVTHSGTVGVHEEPIDLSTLTEEELAAVERIARKAVSAVAGDDAPVGPGRARPPRAP